MQWKSSTYLLFPTEEKIIEPDPLVFCNRVKIRITVNLTSLNIYASLHLCLFFSSFSKKKSCQLIKICNSERKQFLGVQPLSCHCITVHFIIKWTGMKQRFWKVVCFSEAFLHYCNFSSALNNYWTLHLFHWLWCFNRGSNFFCTWLNIFFYIYW